MDGWQEGDNFSRGEIGGCHLFMPQFRERYKVYPDAQPNPNKVSLSFPASNQQMVQCSRGTMSISTVGLEETAGVPTGMR